MRLLAIDPGPEQSAWVLYDTNTGLPIQWQKEPSRPLCNALAVHKAIPRFRPDALAIEMVASYGMAVGREVFETCVIVGRLWQSWRAGRGDDPILVYRRECKMHLCADSRAKDANIRQALIDRYGPGKEAAIGRKASPGPLYGLTGDCWSALAVAITAAETWLEEVAA